MLGSKRQKSRNRKIYIKHWKCCGWCQPESKTRRRMMKCLGVIPDGSYYKKIGSWFEWN